MKLVAAVKDFFGKKPGVVIVTRHPDFENEYLVIGGEVDVIDIDLGSDFNGQPDDEVTAAEFAIGTLIEAEGHGEEVFDAVLDIVAQVVEDFYDADALRGLVDQRHEAWADYHFNGGPNPNES